MSGMLPNGHWDGPPLTVRHAQLINFTAWCKVIGKEQPSIPADAEFPAMFGDNYYPRYEDLPALMSRMDAHLEFMCGGLGDKFQMESVAKLVP